MANPPSDCGHHGKTPHHFRATAAARLCSGKESTASWVISSNNVTFLSSSVQIHRARTTSWTCGTRSYEHVNDLSVARMWDGENCTEEVEWRWRLRPSTGACTIWHPFGVSQQRAKCAPEAIVRCVNHPHRAVNHHVPLTPLAKSVLQQKLQLLPDAVGEGNAGSEFRLTPVASSARATISAR